MRRKLSILAASAALLLNCNLTSPLTGRLFPTEQPSTNSPSQSSGTEETFELSKREQKNIFEDLWGTINEEYLYEDFNGVDWGAVHQAYDAKIEQGLSDQAFYQAMYEMVNELGDEHSIYLTPQQVEEEEKEYEGSIDYVGLGIFVGAVPERDRAVIYFVFPGSPAEQAGLRPHDNILEVDGMPVLDEYGYVTEALLGPEGAPVTLLLEYPGKQPRQVVVNRGRIIGSIHVPYSSYTSLDGQRIGYLLLPTFTDGSVGEQVEEALRALAQEGPLDGLIIDNRINSGGYDTVMNDVIRYFLDGRIGYFVNRDSREPFKVNGKDIQGSMDVPVVVLVGKGTVSFGEVFAGLMQAEDRAYVVGETTDGNVEILWGYDFEDGSRAWIAHDTFVPAKEQDADWETTGIIPDLEVLTAWDLITPDDDPAIQAALEYFDK